MNILNNTSERFYSPKQLNKQNSLWNVVYSGRNDGKTTGIFNEAILPECIKDNKKFVYVRQIDEMFKNGNQHAIFKGINELGFIKKLTGNEWDTIEYKNHCFYLARFDSDLNKNVLDFEPIGYAMSINGVANTKGGEYPNVKHVFFDEFLPVNGLYLPNEWNLFKNLLSTIIRQHDGIKIWLAGNVIGEALLNNPYFQNWGILEDIIDQKEGTIYNYKNEAGEVYLSVERCKINNKSRVSDKYFNYFEDAGDMITNGNWYYNDYKQLPADFKYKEYKNLYNFYLDFRNQKLQFEVLYNNSGIICFCHNFTGDIKENNIILTDKQSVNPYYINDLNNDNIEFLDKIRYFFNNDKVYYQNNKIGMIVKSWLEKNKK